MQGKWLVKGTGKLYIKIWRLVEGSVFKEEKETPRKTANYAKVERKKAPNANLWTNKGEKSTKELGACFKVSTDLNKLFRAYESFSAYGNAVIVVVYFCYLFLCLYKQWTSLMQD